MHSSTSTIPTYTTMPDHPLASEYHTLVTLLRAGQIVETIRPVLEVCFGFWSIEPELCEDGRATLLVRLSSGGALYLTRNGELLAVHQTERDGVLRAQLFTSSAEPPWCTLAVHHPDAIPGRGTLPRYWILRESIAPMISTYAVFDLLCFEVLERAGDRDSIARRVEQANSCSSGCGRVSRSVSIGGTAEMTRPNGRGLAFRPVRRAKIRSATYAHGRDR